MGRPKKSSKEDDSKTDHPYESTESGDEDDGEDSIVLDYDIDFDEDPSTSEKSKRDEHKVSSSKIVKKSSHDKKSSAKNDKKSSSKSVRSHLEEMIGLHHLRQYRLLIDPPYHLDLNPKGHCHQKMI